MIHEAIATGATVDEARANAIAELKAPKDADVHTEILAMPTKKILGLFGGSPAKARAYYETPDAPKAKAEAPKAAPKKAEKAPAKAEKVAPKAEPEAPAKVEEAKSSVEIEIASSKSIQSAVDYLTAVLKGMGVAEMSAKAFRTSDDEIILELDCGEDYGIVIGRRGETLDSIQYLTRLVANKYKTENEYARISINIGSYREKRKNTLRALAKKNSEKVLKYGRNVTFEPMNPYERRIIHTAVQEIEGVTSHSVGEGDRRRVVITPEGGEKKGNYRNDRRGREKRAPYVPSTPAEPREKKVDVSTSLYGRIEPKKKPEETTAE